MPKEYSKLNLYPETHRIIKMIAAYLNKDMAELVNEWALDAIAEHNLPPTPQAATEQDWNPT